MTENLELLAIKDKVANLLLGNTGNIVGAGVSEKDESIIVYLRQENDKGKQHVQSLIGGNIVNGYEIQYRAIGHLQSLVNPFVVYSNRTSYHRPLYGGDSAGSSCIGSGTNGCVVYDAVTKEKLLLSNNHVFACSSMYGYEKASIGDIIYAPGCMDSSACTYPIGTLHKFIPFNSRERNYIDVALVKPNLDTDVSDEIVGLGIPTGWKKAEQDEQIIKSGRTSSITQGNIIDTWATLEIDYGGITIIMSDTIVTSKTGDPGDSGSLGISPTDNKALGLLFAGSDTITCYNRIENVMAGLNILITPDGVVPVPTTPDVLSIGTNQITQFGSVVLGIAAVSLAGKHIIDTATKH